MSYLGYRVLAGALWTAAVVLLIAGSSASSLETRQAFFAWGLLHALGASVLTIWLALTTCVAREADRNARQTAEAVGAALGQILSDPEDGITQLHRRRDRL